MTTNHTELCERLISDIGKAILGEGTESLALVLSRCAALLQSQAARIAELEKERDAILSKVKSTLVHERSLYLSKWKREAITACIERVAALQAEKEKR